MKQDFRIDSNRNGIIIIVRNKTIKNKKDSSQRRIIFHTFDRNAVERLIASVTPEN